LTKPHPAPGFDGRTYGAEVLNLSRNVQIEGMPPAFENPTSGKRNSPGRSHIFIRNTQPTVHSIKRVAIRYTGPRSGGRFVPGRYGLHFHHNHDHVRGSVVEGVVVRDSGSHAFVPHMSDGIALRDTISYNTLETPYWWDVSANDGGMSDPTNNTTWDHTVAALVKAGNTGTGMAYRLSGFSLTEDRSNAVTDSVAVGIQGGPESSGFFWPEGGAGAWDFRRNVAHNNVHNGIFVWQNSRLEEHEIQDFDAYRNGRSIIEHGAYSNSYHYRGVHGFENGTGVESGYRAGLIVHAVPRREEGTAPLSFRDFYVDGGGRTPFGVLFRRHPARSSKTGVLSNFTVTGYTDKPVSLNDGAYKPGRYDLVCWKVGESGRDLEASDFGITSMHPESVYRVQQRDGDAFVLTRLGVAQPVARFADC
jgi:hypothetical protein